jgi:hypothetical protein
VYLSHQHNTHCIGGCREKLERQQQHEDELLRVAEELDRGQRRLAWLQGAEDAERAVWYAHHPSSTAASVFVNSKQRSCAMVYTASCYKQQQHQQQRHQQRRLVGSRIGADAGAAAGDVAAYAAGRGKPQLSTSALAQVVSRLMCSFMMVSPNSDHALYIVRRSMLHSKCALQPQHSRYTSSVLYAVSLLGGKVHSTAPARHLHAIQMLSCLTCRCCSACSDDAKALLKSLKDQQQELLQQAAVQHYGCKVPDRCTAIPTKMNTGPLHITLPHGHMFLDLSRTVHLPPRTAVCMADVLPSHYMP